MLRNFFFYNIVYIVVGVYSQYCYIIIWPAFFIWASVLCSRGAYHFHKTFTSHATESSYGFLNYLGPYYEQGAPWPLWIPTFFLPCVWLDRLAPGVPTTGSDCSHWPSQVKHSMPVYTYQLPTITTDHPSQHWLITNQTIVFGLFPPSPIYL